MGRQGLGQVGGLARVHEDEQGATGDIEAEAEGRALLGEDHAFDLPGSFGHPITVPVALTTESGFNACCPYHKGTVPVGL
jgi:hypothetical protein